MEGELKISYCDMKEGRCHRLILAKMIEEMSVGLQVTSEPSLALFREYASPPCLVEQLRTEFGEE